MRSRSFPRAVAAALVSLLACTGAVTGQSAVESAPPDPGLDTALAAVELMNRVPVGIRETCRPTEPFIEGMSNAIECSVADGLVFYSRFVDTAAVDSIYESLRASSEIAADTGPGCATGASESAYGDEDGTADGRLLCQLTNGTYISVWTDAREPILAGVQLGSDSGFDALAATSAEARLLEAGTGLTPASSAAPAASSAPVAAVSPRPTDGTEGDVILQWASSATASSEFGHDSWSANQATGEPDTLSYGDIATAWAPADSDAGPQWLELGFEVPVRPTEIVIWESSGAGFVTLVEALDERSGEWVSLWQGVDRSPDALIGFSPPLESLDVVTDTVRVTIDTYAPGWNEVDAVGLFGVPVGS